MSELNLRIWKKLITQAENALNNVNSMADTPHSGLKGAYKEIVIRDLVRPILQPTVGVGTGEIINPFKTKREHQNQDDIIIYDSQLTPAILVGEQTGIFIPNNVLAYLEVKSKLNATELNRYKRASLELGEMRHAVPANHENVEAEMQNGGIVSGLLAFESDLKNENPFDEIDRFFRSDPQFARSNILCIVGVGVFVKRRIGETLINGGKGIWARASFERAPEQLAFLMAYLSTNVSLARASRLGRSSLTNMEVGLLPLVPDAKFINYEINN